MPIVDMNISMQMEKADLSDQIELLAPGRYTEGEKFAFVSQIQSDPAMDFFTYFRHVLEDDEVEEATIQGHLSGITVLWLNNAGITLGPVTS